MIFPQIFRFGARIQMFILSIVSFYFSHEFQECLFMLLETKQYELLKEPKQKKKRLLMK